MTFIQQRQGPTDKTKRRHEIVDKNESESMKFGKPLYGIELLLLLFFSCMHTCASVSEMVAVFSALLAICIHNSYTGTHTVQHCTLDRSTWYPERAYTGVGSETSCSSQYVIWCFEWKSNKNRIINGSTRTYSHDSLYTQYKIQYKSKIILTNTHAVHGMNPKSCGISNDKGHQMYRKNAKI